MYPSRVVFIYVQEERSWAEMEAELGEVVRGGQYQPPACRPRHSVAIIVPLRDREAHLKIFLYFLHPILMRQNLHYRIFVISQDDKLTFNRAMLFNVGFVEAAKLEDWDCYGRSSKKARPSLGLGWAVQ